MYNVGYCPQCREMKCSSRSDWKHICPDCGSTMKDTLYKVSQWDTEKKELYIFDGMWYPEKKLIFHTIYYYICLIIAYIYDAFAILNVISNIVMYSYASKYIEPRNTPDWVVSCFTVIVYAADIYLCYCIRHTNNVHTKEYTDCVIVRQVVRFIGMSLLYISYWPVSVIENLIVNAIPVVYYRINAKYFDGQHISRNAKSFEEEAAYVHFCRNCRDTVYYSFESITHENCPKCCSELVSTQLRLSEYRSMDSYGRKQQRYRSVGQDDYFWN